MGRKKKKKKFKKPFSKERWYQRFALPEEIQQKIWGVFLILIAIIISLSFFEKAGVAGNLFIKGSRFIIGNTIFIVPLIFLLAGLVFLANKKGLMEKGVFWPIILAIFILSLGISAFLGIFNPEEKMGGWLGYFLSWPFLKYFGFWASLFILLTPVLIGILIFWQFLRPVFSQKEKEFKPSIRPDFVEESSSPTKTSIIKKIFPPKFKIKKIQEEKDVAFGRMGMSGLDTSSIKSERVDKVKKIFSYQPPSLNLLEKDHGMPTSGDTRVNSAIIKRTLENFNIDVTMSEINIGPTVTQYTFKPAEGIKLSRITALSNDLSLALASHPIRIEAPIPGRSLVGVEVPNKVRARVRLRNLIENPTFQKSLSSLLIPLGRDVSGFPVYADLSKMPHLLVAGSTGSGKTIFLSSLILSLLYQPRSASPQMLRFILVDPKRVEFPVYQNLPHLLCPVIYNAAQTVNALRWLTREMERRFDVLSEAQARNINSFNETALRRGSEPLPFIVLIIDELADLMAAKGREIEAGIVRLAQMARAVGIHLVVATQRPSVEVITGLIKANITSRITFQVASQVDSRTILDASGAEKLLGSGDMLYVSAQVPKPKRIQAPYVSEKEVRKAVSSIKSKEEIESKTEIEEGLAQELEKGTEEAAQSQMDYGYDQEDPLYEEAKKVVIENKRASASLLQRRLRLGYARAARLIDMLEERGVVGPAEGAKPREVYGEKEPSELEEKLKEPENSDEGEWSKV